MASAVAVQASSAPAATPTPPSTTSSSWTHQHHHHHPHAQAIPSVSSVLRRAIPWDTYVAAKLLDPGLDAAALRAADKIFSTRRAVAAAALNSSSSSALPSSSSSASLPLDASSPSPEELSATAALLAVLRGVTKEETVQYMLAVLDAEVAGNPRRARELLIARRGGHGDEGGGEDVSSSSPSSPPDAADLFLLALARPDWFSVERTASLLGACFGGAGGGGGGSSSSPNERRQRALFLDWVLAQLQRPAHAARGMPTAAGALAKLLRAREAREAAAAAGAPRLLVPLVQRLTSSSSFSTSPSTSATPSVPATPQLAYDLCISLWQLALTPEGAEAAVAAGAVPALTDVLRATVAAKEKVVRAAALALRALLLAGGASGSGGGESSSNDAAAVPSTSSSLCSSSASSSSAAGAAAVSCGLARVCDSLLAQQWEDDDVPAALGACREAALAAARRAASWPVYRAEVLGGRLDWGPAHEGGGGGIGGGEVGKGGVGGFWAANARRLEERDCEVLRTLVRLLDAPSSDARTLAVACSDIARYADASEPPERARSLLASLGANARATALLAHPDPEVRRHALAAVQRLVLSRDKLQYLNS